MTAPTPPARVARAPRHDPAPSPATLPVHDAIRSFAPGASARIGDGTLELGGGAAVALDRLPSTLPLDWQEEALAFVQRACAEARRSPAPSLTLPPALLAGAPGSGRLHFARLVALQAGLPHFVWDLSRMANPEGASPIDLALPPPPTMAMIASGRANPIVSVLGVDDAPDIVRELLVEMLDPRTGRRRVEPSLGATVDHSRASWLVHTAAPLRLPARLTRLCETVTFHPLDDCRARLAMLSALVEAAAELGLDVPERLDAPPDPPRVWRRPQPFSEILAAAREALTAAGRPA